MTLESECVDNKRLKKDFCLAQWDNGPFEDVASHSKVPATHFPYDLTLSDTVFDVKSNGLMTLQQAVTVHKATSIFGFTKSLKPSDAKKYAVKLDEDSVCFSRREGK